MSLTYQVVVISMATMVYFSGCQGLRHQPDASLSAEMQQYSDWIANDDHFLIAEKIEIDAEVGPEDVESIHKRPSFLIDKHDFEAIYGVEVSDGALLISNFRDDVGYGTLLVERDMVDKGFMAAQPFLASVPDLGEDVRLYHTYLGFDFESKNYATLFRKVEIDGQMQVITKTVDSLLLSFEGIGSDERRFSFDIFAKRPWPITMITYSRPYLKALLLSLDERDRLRLGEDQQKLDFSQTDLEYLTFDLLDQRGSFALLQMMMEDVTEKGLSQRYDVILANCYTAALKSILQSSNRMAKEGLLSSESMEQRSLGIDSIAESPTEIQGQMILSTFVGWKDPLVGYGVVSPGETWEKFDWGQR